MIEKNDAENIAEIISNERYAIAQKLISSRIQTNYYNPELPEDRLLTIPEAFFTSFKGISDDEIIDLLEKHNYEAFDGVFKGLSSGYTATYDEVFDIALSSKNVERNTILFMENELGSFAAKQYETNLKFQKEVAESIIISHFNLSSGKVNIQKELEEKGILGMTNNLISRYEIPASISIAKRYEHIDLKKSGSFGVPFYNITLDKKTATFASGVEIRHMFKDKNTIDKIEASVERNTYTREVDNKRERKNKLE